MIHIHQTHDYELLASLNREVQEHHHFLYPDVFKPYDKDTVLPFYKEALKNKGYAFVADFDNKPAGYVLLFIKELPENLFQYAQHFLLIDQIGTLKDFRGKGIASALLQKAAEFAKENGTNQMRLNHWTMNENAGALFLKNGFTYFNENMWKYL
ncbi:GNAT family N-acetyltransferase [Flavobacterium sp.]|uniref:GNAT family N-acetyltransferase n=1 Tax=Flavobacterium sp. TaxID=239 RepID=UPI0026094F67|nr:GNAT family N-acetyltransferase [Flavobacterium sp.]